MLSALGLEGARGKRAAPRDPAAHERYLQALGYLQHPEHEASLDGAIAILERLDATEAPSAPILAALGRAYLAKHRLTFHRNWENKAVGCCERAMALEPDTPDVLVSIGDMRVSTGQHAEAIRAYQRALELRPGMPEALIGISRAYEGAGQPSAGEEALQELIALHSSDARAYSRLGFLHFNQSCFPSAAEAWAMASRLDPGDPHSPSNLGGALYYLDRLEEALEACRKSIEIPAERPCVLDPGNGSLLPRPFGGVRHRFQEGCAARPHRSGDLGRAGQRLFLDTGP